MVASNRMNICFISLYMYSLLELLIASSSLFIYVQMAIEIIKCLIPPLKISQIGFLVSMILSILVSV